MSRAAAFITMIFFTFTLVSVHSVKAEDLPYDIDYEQVYYMETLGISFNTCCTFLWLDLWWDNPEDDVVSDLTDECQNDGGSADLSTDWSGCHDYSMGWGGVDACAYTLNVTGECTGSSSSSSS